MTHQKIVDHLFRHHYGKMVSILTRIFGLSNIEIVEDAVQDTFTQAILKWRNQVPPNPEAWLTKAAKNRAIDLLRQIEAEQNRFDKITSGSSAIYLNELFLDHEIEDSQLRMIFVACHPKLDSKEQIAFALKTISGFSAREIAAALLTKEETIKKRLSRARNKISNESITFDFPDQHEMPTRLARVMEVIYLTFNEGFHSNNKENLIREDLCGEAIRLCQLLLRKENLRTSKLYALFALMCFHAARLETKINDQNEIVDIINQDRSKWFAPLIVLGNDAMNKATEESEFSSFHYEAAIAGEHLRASSFEKTNWQNILGWYKKLDELQSSEVSRLNLAIVNIQLGELTLAREILDQIKINELGQRAYLFYGCEAEYYKRKDNIVKARLCLEQAIDKVSNELEKRYLIKKREELALN